MLRRTRIPNVVLAAAGLALAVAAYRLWSLLVTNLHVPGSLAWSNPLVVPLTLALTVATMLPFAILGYRLRSTPTLLVILFAVPTVIAAYVVFPVACDTTESFVDQPNRRCTCAGRTVRWYPRGVFDYADVEYCIGLETPVGAGQ